MTSNLELIRNLRQQINESPEDYALRMIYADALEESGDYNFDREAFVIRNRIWVREPYRFENMPHRVAGRSTDFVEIIRIQMRYWLMHGNDIVRKMPIQRVLITDRIPISNPQQTEWLFFRGSLNWYSDPRLPLPSCIFDHLKWLDGYVLMRVYPSLRSARLALSDACIAWAKSQ